MSKIKYIKSKSKTYKFNNGGSYISFSFDAEEIKKFLVKARNNKFYFNFYVAKKQQPDQWGNEYNTYQIENDFNSNDTQPLPKESKPKAEDKAGADEVDNSDLVESTFSEDQE